jgi:hypothetical protein
MTTTKLKILKDPPNPLLAHSRFLLLQQAIDVQLAIHPFPLALRKIHDPQPFAEVPSWKNE